MHCQAHRLGCSTLGRADRCSEPWSSHRCLLAANTCRVHSYLLVSGSNQIWCCCRIVVLVPLQPRGDCFLFLCCSFLIIRGLGRSDGSEEGLRSPVTSSAARLSNASCFLGRVALGDTQTNVNQNVLNQNDAVFRELYSISCDKP